MAATSALPWAVEDKALLKSLNVSYPEGLSDAQVAKLREQHGPNGESFVRIFELFVGVKKKKTENGNWPFRKFFPSCPSSPCSRHAELPEEESEKMFCSAAFHFLPMGASVVTPFLRSDFFSVFQSSPCCRWCWSSLTTLS
jgi:hypothetical protein